MIDVGRYDQEMAQAQDDYAALLDAVRHLVHSPRSGEMRAAIALGQYLVEGLSHYQVANLLVAAMIKEAKQDGPCR